MEYIYAAMLLHKAGKKVDEESIKKVLSAAGVEVDDARAKALVASLEGVDIEDAIATAAAAPVAAAPVAQEAEKKEEEEEEEEVDEAAAAQGLSSLFG